MKVFSNGLYEYILQKISFMTIKQANIFTTIFIFLFTVVFAILLIRENYHDYEIALFSDKIEKSSSGVLLHTEEEREKKLKALLIKNTIAIATLAFILFAIVLGVYKVLNSLIQNDIQAFLDFFKANVHNEKSMNTDEIFFKDFKIMVGYANDMVRTINEQKKSLEELNANLEDKVEEKTRDLVKSNRNLLEEKQFSEDILKSQKEFLRYTVHETNTPLSVILASIELFVMKHGKDKQLSKIEVATKNIFNIYDDLSYLVKKDQVSYPKVAIELGSYINSRIDFFTEVAALAKLRFYYNKYDTKMFVYFNETKLQRVVDNTITNAIKYTFADEVIDVNVVPNGLYVDFSVGSKSREIKDKEKIFSSFYREEKHTEGFGIGLRLVKSICDEENVEISLESNVERTIFKYRFKMMGE